MPAPKRISAVAIAAVLALALIANASALGNAHVRDSTHKYKVRPHTLYFTFGALFPPIKINKIPRWHGWGDDSTRAHGVLRYDDCKPNCAEGHYRSRPTKVKLSHIHHCHGKRVYRRIAINPKGLPTHKHTITCGGHLR